MIQRLNILIAEDHLEERRILKENVLEFFNELQFETAFTLKSSYNEIMQDIIEKQKSEIYYDLAFCDIDFTEDQKGGKRDSGFKIIEKLFEVCPITKICTYSGQFRAIDLWSRYEELQKRGLVIRTFDKQHGESGEVNWIINNLRKVYEEIRSDYYLWDVWKNNKLILETISSNNNIDFKEKLQIKEKLDFIITSLLNEKNKIDETESFSSVILRYHQILEVFCKSIYKNDENKILNMFMNNKTYLEKEIQRKLNEDKDSKSLKNIGSNPNTKFFRFGYKLNFYRNYSVHENKDFLPDIANVLFSNLCLTLYVVGKEAANYDSIEEKTSGMIDCKGKKDLDELISFIRN